MSEYEKYQELQSKSQKMQEDYDRQLEEMEASKEQALSELTEYFETKLQEKTGQLEQVRYRGLIIKLSHGEPWFKINKIVATLFSWHVGQHR